MCFFQCVCVCAESEVRYASGQIGEGVLPAVDCRQSVITMVNAKKRSSEKKSTTTSSLSLP